MLLIVGVFLSSDLGLREKQHLVILKLHIWKFVLIYY